MRSTMESSFRARSPYSHPFSLNANGRDPLAGPRGPGATKQKNSLPELWLEEIVLHALDRARDCGREADVVVDVCAGWQSMKAVCRKLGLRYIALDVHGDRNGRASHKKDQ